MNNQKEYFKTIANYNKEIFNTGMYICNNDTLNIKEEITKSILNTELYENVTLAPLFKNKTYFKVEDNIIEASTTDYAIQLREMGVEGNIIALNFASATTPGGGYLKGSVAQEECLCRASMLYPTLIKKKEMYSKNRANYSPLYTDSMIYSPNVPIIRKSNQVLIEPVLCSFITSPAVNKKVAKTMLFSDNNINSAMKKRIDKIISLAVSKNPKVIILGAFGCGVFGNDRKDVYKFFEESINKYVDLSKTKIAFAVINTKNKR